jgi:transposase InsO family protein
VPRRLLSDNGLALNPSRRGYLGQLVDHVSSLGVEPITGKPYKPTTQGTNERFHRTLSRYLDRQPLAACLAQLQSQVDAFDHIYGEILIEHTRDAPGITYVGNGRPCGPRQDP